MAAVLPERMSQRVLIRHSTGSKASKVEEFLVSGARDLLFGRDPSCDVTFDRDRDEFVSRRHMKLVVADADRLDFRVEDLGALNGTFINRRRVRGFAELHPGDLVQLGAGGPEFTFDVAPEDLSVTPVSGIVPDEDAPPATAERLCMTPSAPPKAPARPKGAPRRSIAGLAVLAAAVLAVWHFAGPMRTLKPGRIAAAARELGARWLGALRFSRPPAPEEVVRRNAESLVTVVTAWRLVDSTTGRPLKQIYIPNRRELSDSGSPPLILNAGRELPVFVLLAGNRLQPLLTVAEQSSYRPIGGKRRSAGFAAGPDRMILTSRSVTSPWRTPYDWPPGDAAGIVAVFDAQLELVKTAVIARRQFPRWLPADAEFVLETGLDQTSIQVSRRIHAKGLSDSMAVYTSSGHQGIAASMVRESESGLAAIRLSAPFVAHGAVIETKAGPKVGDSLVMAGIGDAKPAMGKLSTVDPAGRYCLVVDEARTAGAGAPVFDRMGRVVAVQIEGDPLRPGRSFAVSIDRALEILGQASAREMSTSVSRSAAANL
jgi:hypothetical protein